MPAPTSSSTAAAWSSPGRRPPIEFEVEGEAAVQAAEQELVAKGFDLLHATKTEPWGQTVTRVQTEDGAIVGISYAPWMHT